jgi:hypothetical protein
MSKGDSPRPGKKKPLPTPKPNQNPKGSEGGGGGGGHPPKSRECWNFRLTSPTPAAHNAELGMSVVGVPQGSRIIVQGNSGVLGFAPTDVSAKMISAVGKSGGRLTGQITSESEARVSAEVQLCIS